jgi:GNAT superfamily N-acetyltransferase
MCAAQMMNAGYEKGVKDMEWNLQGLSEPFFLREFVPKDAPEELWQAYFTLSEMSLHEFHKRDRLPDRGAVRKMLSAPSPLYHVRRWIVLDEGQSAIASDSMIYDSEISPDYESNKHVCQVRILVVPAYRRKKIATHLVKHTIETAGLLEKDAVMAEADNPLGLDFCKHLRGELVHEEVHHRLYVEDIDW